jgi:single-strand DNA-binding protein
MVNVNRVILAGNLTRDPETRRIPSGTAVCDFSVAVNRTWTDRTTNEKREEVSFIDVETWGRQAEVAQEYLKKGRAVLIEGRLKQDRWESKEGKKMSRLKVYAERLHFLGPKPEGGQAERQEDPDVPF